MADIDGANEELAEVSDKTTPAVRLFPDLFVSGLTASVLLLCLYSVLCIFLPATLDVRANTLTPPSDSKPAWYFLFLYRYLGSVPPLVGALTPVALLVVLGVWPFLDRNPSREPRKRVFALALVAVTVGTILTLSYLGRAK